MGHGPADHHGVGAESDGLEHVGAAPQPAIDDERQRVAHGSAHEGQRLRGGRRGVERAAAVVADDEARHAQRLRLARIQRVQHAFQPHRQPRMRLQPGHVVPSGCVRGLTGAERIWRRVGHVRIAQMHGMHIGWQGEVGAPFAVAHALHRGIHREDDGFEASGFRPLHQRAVETPVGLPVQLKPQRPAPRVGQHGLGDLLHRHIG